MDAKRGDMVRIQIGSLYHYGVFVSEDEVIQFGYPPLPEFAGQNAVVTVGKVDSRPLPAGRSSRPPSSTRRRKKSAAARSKPSPGRASGSARAATT